jgi:hypothetical protein
VFSNTDGGKGGMANYRAYFVGLDGHFIRFEAVVCTDDGEAIDKVKRLVEGHDIELWSGARFIARLSATGKSGGEVR